MPVCRVICYEVIVYQIPLPNLHNLVSPTTSSTPLTCAAASRPTPVQRPLNFRKQHIQPPYETLLTNPTSRNTNKPPTRPAREQPPSTNATKVATTTTNRHRTSARARMPLPRRRRPPRPGALSELPPLRILTQIVALQVLYYVSAVVMILFTTLVMGTPFRLLDDILGWTALRGDTTTGWLLGMVWMANAFFM